MCQAAQVADETAVDVLRLLASGDRARAADLAATSPGALCAALATHLSRDAAAPVYDDARAFQAFISHGTNPALYARAIAEIADVQLRRRPRSVLDIGCGDGRITAESLAPGVERLDLVEPAATMLHQAVARFAGRDGVTGRADTVEHVLAGNDDRWDLVQSTFAMHNLAPDARRGVWADLAGRTRTLVVAEFDVPAFADRSDAHCTYLAERYAIGIAEYADHPEVVHGFLMPVLVGQLAPEAEPRYTYEQPVDRWAHELEEAGFAVSRRRIFPYWWADAWLLVGVTDAGGSAGLGGPAEPG